MTYDVIITGIRNPRSKTILAHHLAQTPGVSLQYAQHMVDKLPFIYERGVSKQQVADLLPQLTRMGISFDVKAAQPAPHASRQASAKHEQEPEPEEAAMPQHGPSASVRPAPSAVHSVPRYIVSVKQDPVNRRAVILVVAGGLVALAALGFWLGRGGAPRVRLSDPTVTVTGEASGSSSSAGTSLSRAQGQPTPEAGQARNHADAREPATSEGKARAQEYLDSASACGSDDMKAIHFYRMAVSFNKNNVHAWYGLINAYSNAGLESKARDAREEMLRALGPQSMSVAEVLKRFGVAIDAYKAADGTYRVEYRTRAATERELVEETYVLARSLRAVCQCSGVSLFASTGKNRGLLAYVGTGSFPRNLDEYRTTASLTYLK